MANEVFVEDDTDPIDYVLLKAPAAGELPVPFDATGFTPTMVIKSRAGASVTTSGKVTWADQTASTVRFSPAAGDLLKSASPYYVHWILTDGAGKTASWPKGGGEEWVIEKRGES
jgi:hypothetical protein